MRRELNLYRTACKRRKFLIELAQMAMRAADGIGVIPLAQLGVQEIFLEAAPGARHSAFEIKNDIVKINHPRRDKRPERVLAGGRVTAGPGHKTRMTDFVAVKLGQPINRLLLTLQRGMCPTIP